MTRKIENRREWEKGELEMRRKEDRRQTDTDRMRKIVQEIRRKLEGTGEEEKGAKRNDGR